MGDKVVLDGVVEFIDFVSSHPDGGVEHYVDFKDQLHNMQEMRASLNHRPCSCGEKKRS